MKRIDILKDISIVLDFLWYDLPSKERDEVQEMVETDTEIQAFLQDVESVVIKLNLTKKDAFDLFKESQKKISTSIKKMVENN